MIAAIRELPPGNIVSRTRHDPFPGVPDGIPIQAEITVDPDGGRIDVDLRDNPDCQPCGLNLSEATARCAVMLGVFNSIDHTVPPNAGSFRRLRIHLRDNCVVGIPRHPVSCSVATTNLADRLANAVQRGMAELGEGIGLADAGTPQPPAQAVISGTDPRSNQPFVNQIILPSITGGPGGPAADGWLTLGNPVLAGMAFRDSVEVDEIHHPIRVVAQYILPDTEGAGRFRGSPGAFVEYGPVDCTLEAIYVSDSTVGAPLGARGGLGGAPATQFKRGRDGTAIPIPAAGHIFLEPGETILSISCGGGGYGPASERDPQRVREDVAEGWISAGRAREVYGIDVHPPARHLLRSVSLRDAADAATEELDRPQKGSGKSSWKGRSSGSGRGVGHE
jgi:N-methylhydantoinase B